MEGTERNGKERMHRKGKEIRACFLDRKLEDRKVTEMNEKERKGKE